MIRATYVIAEAGVNHNGRLDLALDLVDAAADAGADAVKFQAFRADSLATADAARARYQVATTGSDASQHALLRGLELPGETFAALRDRCAARGVDFLASPFDLDSIDLLVGLGLRVFKVPSGEITNLPYLRRIGRLAGDVILSTGMARLGEVDDALDVLVDAGTARDRITVLHCNTEYPTPFPDVNLRAMVTLRDALGVRVGYSDHTPGIEVAVAAVALGATVIEKHFTRDRSLPGPDHQASLEPAELAALVRAVRHVEQALGDGRKRPSPSESRNRPLVRKSIVAAVDIPRGTVLTDANLAAKRPAGGLSPMRWDDVVGRRATRDYRRDERIAIDGTGDPPAAADGATREGESTR